MNVAEYVEMHSITIVKVVEEGHMTSEDGWHHFAMRISIRCGTTKRQVTITWRQGTAHGETHPSVEAVFYAFISDARAYWDAQTPENFANEFGYDYDTNDDKRKVSKLFTACKGEYTKALRFLGSESEFENAVDLEEE